MNDLINRADAIDTVKKHYRSHDNDLLELIAFDIERLPSEEPEIIRCKNCKHRHTEDCPMYHVEWVEYDDDGYIEMDDIEYDNTEDDGFCYKGVRYGFN